MPSKSRRHKNYKAYVSQQLRILQMKFPFLSSKQIKAKICSSWDAFSQEKKDKWGTPVEKHDFRENTPNELTTKLNKILHGQSPPRKYKHVSRKLLMTSPNKDKKKKVRFMDPILTMEESPEELTEEMDDGKFNAWPNATVDDFNAIMAHKLKIEIEKTDPDDDDDDDDGSGDQSQWPLFGDNFKTIMPLDEESDEQQLLSSQEGDLMCDMFDEIKSKKHFSNKRLLTCADDPIAKVARRAKLFHEDHEFFA